MAGPLQVFMVRMWASLWNAPSRPLLHVSCIHPYMHQSRITGKISLQWKGFRRSDWNLHTHSSSSSAALPHFCSVCLCVQHINDLTSSVKNIRFSRFMRQFLFCSASLQIDFSGAAACRLIIQHDLDSCMTRQRLDTRKPHVFLSFWGGGGCSTTALQLSASPFSYQSIPR